MGPMLFNRIPKTVKDKTTIETFKSSLDDYLMSLPDTPPTPGYVAANNNSVLDWTVANGRALSKVLSWELLSNKPKYPKYPLIGQFSF